MLGDGRQRGEQGDGFQPGVGVVGQTAGHRIPDSNMIGNKNGIERGRLGFPGQFGIITKGKNFFSRRLRVTPGEAIIALGIEEEQIQNHRVFRHRRAHLADGHSLAG